MDNYTLGIMWSIGTLQKNTSRYTIQTFEKNKLPYLEKVAAIKDKAVKITERESRGKTRTMYSIFISDKDYADQLRSLGYDDPEIEIPEGVDDNFMAAMLELSVTRYINGYDSGECGNGKYGYESFTIISDNCDAWNKYLLDKFNIPMKKVLTGVMTRINFGRNDMLRIAEYMINVEKSNKDYWKDILSTCRTLVR